MFAFSMVYAYYRQMRRVEETERLRQEREGILVKLQQQHHHQGPGPGGEEQAA